MSRSRLALAAFALVAALNLAAVGFGSTLGQWLTKPLLVPLLAAYAILSGRASRRLMIALALAFAGDIVLQVPGTLALIIGMLLFLGAYGGYALAFIRAGAWSRLAWWIPVAYAVAVIATLVWLWPGLSDAGLAYPMAGYAVVLATMAVTAAGMGWWIGLGGGLILLSDTLIGVRLAEVADVPGIHVWTMLTYILGQLLVVTGWVGSEDERLHAGTSAYGSVPR